MHTSGSGKLAHCVRKRELSPLQRARLSLGLEVDAQPRTRLVWLLRATGLGNTGISYLRWSEDEQARKVVALHDRLNPTERKATTIDYLIMAAGVDQHHIWGCIQEELSRVAETLACVNAPKVVRAVIDRALKPDGYQDQKLVLQIAGILPVPGQPGPLALFGRKG